MKPTAFLNGTIFTGERILTQKAILVQNGFIEDIVEEVSVPAHYERSDLKGRNIAPSFIDLQIYGGNGSLFSQEMSVESLHATHEYCMSGGAAHFMITMATNSINRFVEGIELVRRYWDNGGQGLLGLHLEGPYINPIKKGAHIEKYIRQPTLNEVQVLLDKGADVIKMMTLAPECCDQSVIDLLLQNNILVSAGHSNAVYEEGTRAFNNGILTATHLFNAMSGFQHRAPGMVGAIYDHPQVNCSVVCDGVHVDYAAIRVSKKIMKERLFFITDAVAETSTGDYIHVYKGDRYTLPDGTLSGSSLTMMQCVKNAVQHVGIELDEALRMASLYPARLLGGDCKLGKIEKGYKASFVVFDEAFNIER
jgi:N-acetylglucosamine-6-phosphate deacetylase